MIDILDELTEIPFELFISKWQELKPGSFNRERAESTWFYMHETDRIEAFKALASNYPLLQLCREPFVFLGYYSMKF